MTDNLTVADVLSRAPSDLAIKVDGRLRKWRRKEEADDGALLHGISRIRQGIGEKVEVREALEWLHSRGRVKRVDCANGVFWQSAPADKITIAPTDYVAIARSKIGEAQIMEAFERKMWADYHAQPFHEQSVPPLSRDRSNRYYESGWVREKFGNFALGYVAGFAAALAAERGL